jgi:hypothetical protein
MCRREGRGGRAVEERAAQRKLHPAIGSSRQTFQREWRPEGVPEQMLQAFAVALVDMRTCLQREAFEKGNQLLGILFGRLGQAQRPLDCLGLHARKAAEVLLL